MNLEASKVKADGETKWWTKYETKCPGGEIRITIRIRVGRYTPYR